LQEQISRPSNPRSDFILVDGLNAAFPRDFNIDLINRVKAGDFTVIHVTIPDVESFSLEYVVNELSELFERAKKLREYGLEIVSSVKQIRDVKRKNGVAVLLGAQGAGFLGLDLSRLDFMYALGMRTMQPTYQQRNQFGSGCGEKKDEGLSELGIKWVERMNELGMLISLSHVGYRTSMDVLQLSKDPVVFSHSNAKSLCDHVRNITDDQIKVCAEKGGVIGLCPLSMFISADKEVSSLSVDDYLMHIDYVVRLVGIDHVGIGLDMMETSLSKEQVLKERQIHPTLSSTQTIKVEDEFLKSDRKELFDYELYTPWLKSISEFSLVTDALTKLGYSDSDLRKLLGENFLRVFERTFG